jgi:N-acetyl-alpha-D-muramate 1-phosphate uridylyltransferase
LNSDAVWTGANPLTQLAQAWDGARMEALLLLRAQPNSDFRLDRSGRIDRGKGGEDHLYLGACIVAPDRLLAIPETKFSLNRPWDAMIAAGTAYGVVHQGGWCDVGRPEGIAIAERLLHDAGHG